MLRLRRQKRDDVALTAEEAAMEREMQSKVLRVTEFVTANELAHYDGCSGYQIISTCMSLGYVRFDKPTFGCRNI